ncbi:hypothetical protein BCR37DRAFT_384501 [Protomyces lactucae-debilis]|uniref:Uncharacterized protein n=1 Tax=Protomyces lactucae-debilis TaxID=2754530 RepID=A0A1Y2ES13_PROLT|nr:uncharacterized protein BCR37DRAFT_384501 [Protomyces lactucae-debilis]ORY74373.1 hypothetical protein BCR37DRAFT_384501 [Protomyces lactucae-debilis]
MQTVSIALAMVASVAAQKYSSVQTGAQVAFAGDDFGTFGASVLTALPAANNDEGGKWYLNYYNFGRSFQDTRQILAYYPSAQLSGGNTCVGIIQGIAGGNKGDTPNGENGGCDAIWGNGCSYHILQAIQAGCNGTMFSGLPEICGTLNVEVKQVNQASFTPANPAVWLTWDYSTANSNSSLVREARELTYPVFARTEDGKANLACLRVAGAGSTIRASFLSVAAVASAAAYMLL